MKKYLYLSVFVTCLLLMSFSCRINVIRGEGNIGTISPTVTPFTSVEIDVPVNVSITVQEGASTNLQLSGYENILKIIRTKVENGTLKLYTDNNVNWILDRNQQITATINMSTLQQFSGSGATNAEIHGIIKGKDFKMDLSGSSKVIIDNLNVTNFSTEASGSANIEVKEGIVQKAEYSISGAGKISTFPLQASEVELAISGAGSCNVFASQKLSVNISGAGSVKYKGHPQVTKDISGAGSIKDVNE